VTQKDTEALAIGQKVLVIAGNQARVVPDYTVPQAPPNPTAAAPQEAPTTIAPPPPPVLAVPLPAPDQPKVETGS
jgi:outer membrane lipoprotein SlyB